MLKLVVINEVKNQSLHIKLVGEIDEFADFQRFIQSPPLELIINCKEVSRITSRGVRQWIQFFKKLTTLGTKVKVTECSPAVVQQLNLVRDFALGSRVESIYLPFLCDSCQAPFISLLRIEGIKTIPEKLPSPACPKCGEGKVVFDDIPSEYFGFLLHQSH